MNISTSSVSFTATNRTPANRLNNVGASHSVNLNATPTAQVPSSEQTQAADNPTYSRPSTPQNTATVTPELVNKASTEEQGESYARGGAEQGKKENSDSTVGKEAQQQAKESGNGQFTEAELELISDLKLRDSEVQKHERAHEAVGGQYTGSPSYSYKTGPDGVKYAVSGEVSIDTSRIPNNPEATLQKAQQIKAAALAPSQPSAQDRRVAAKAEQMAAQARSEIVQENSGHGEDKIGGANARYHVSQSDHFTRTQSLEQEEQQQSLSHRIAHISDVYHSSSISKITSTFQTQV